MRARGVGVMRRGALRRLIAGGSLLLVAFAFIAQGARAAPAADAVVAAAVAGSAGTRDAVAGARDVVAGARDAMAGATNAAAGARDAMVGATNAVAGAKNAMAGATNAVAGARDAVAGATNAVGDAKDAVAGPRAATGENPARARAAGGDPSVSAWTRSPSLAREALDWLRRAPEDGLRVRDYLDPALASVQARAQARPSDAQAQAALGRLLHAAVLRYLTDLNRGRVPPAAWPPGYAAVADTGFGARAALDRALAEGDLGSAVRAARPSLPQYERLREALATYRALDEVAAWDAPLPPARDATGGRVPSVRPGMAWLGADRLRARLLALGDLAPESAIGPMAPEARGDRSIDTTVPGPSSAAGVARYEGDLAEAVRRFQRRHGLEADGVIGPRTREALEVRPSRRARQIELALERLRWTPLAGPGPRIVINVPEFLLRAYAVEAPGIGPEGDSTVGGEAGGTGPRDTSPVGAGGSAGNLAHAGGRFRLAHTMRVVVGRALDTRTPLLAAMMTEVEFNPYWNVPDSIARQELVPSLREHPERWEQQGYELVTARGQVVEALDASMLEAVEAGQARIRQRPGPRNALGAIVFRFPNAQQVYLHHTPATGLFDQGRRDFSHGCIRVEDPVSLAAFVLAGKPEGDPARIRAAMASGERSTLRLARPVPVVITHVTAVARADGVHFRPDLYGHDAALERLLSRSRP